MGFPKNLLISGKSLSKIFFTETEETVLESVCSSETISFPFFEIVQAVLLEVPSVLIFKSESILSTTSSILGARTISKNEIVSDENTDSDTVSSVFAKRIFDDDLPEIKRFIGNPKSVSFTKNWYSRPTLPDMQFEERVFQTQFSVSANKLYEWNIDGLSEQEIINKMSHMSMVGIAYQNNHDLDQPDIVNLLVTGFSGTLRGW